MWRNPAQQRWTEHNAREHFTHNTGLVNAAEQLSGHATGGKNHSDLQH
jgi:hypothetical protein